jgi:hypothetical protein
MTLRGKTALVTGASGGIGLALADCFARDGADLVIVARREAELARLAADWGARHGVRVTPVPADLARLGEVERVVAAVESAGIAVDCLVDNAGHGSFGLFVESDLDAELAMMAVNMTALTALSKTDARRSA